MSKTEDFLDSQGWVIEKLSEILSKCTDEQKAQTLRLHMNRLISIRNFLASHKKELEAHE